MELLDFVVTHQAVFEAIKRAGDDPSEYNILSAQRSIKMLAESERWVGRGDVLGLLILGSPLLVGLQYLLS
jgi:hypothetical protein